VLYWYETVIADTPKSKEKLSESDAWVDVRDIAEAHILALEKEAAGNERIIVSAGSWIWQEWGAFLHFRKAFPSLT